MGARGSKGFVTGYANMAADEQPVALTVAPPIILSGGWKLIGDGIADADSGLVTQAADNGVGRLTTTNEANHAAFLATGVAFRPDRAAPMTLEARVALPALTARRVFVGIGDEAAATIANVLTGSTATLTLTQSDLAGFFFDSVLTSGNWHAAYNGGATAGPTASGDVVTGVAPAAEGFQLLRLRVGPDGRVIFRIEDEVVADIAGAVDPTVRFAFLIGVSATTTTVASLDVEDGACYKASKYWG